MQPGQSVAQKLISVILPSSCWEVIFSPLIVVRSRFFIEEVCRLKNKSAATNAIINLSVQEKKPITNGIITCLNIKQAQIRSDLKKKNKGGEAAIAAIKLLSITNRK